MNLAAALSKLGICSRGQARERIAHGRVRVNGEEALDPRRHVDLTRDRIELDGVAVAQAPRACLAMHKPAGIVTTRIDARGRATVYDLLPPELRTLWPIGRLDKQTSGLLLWTNDWRFGDGVRDPASRTEKEYRVRLDRPLAAPSDESEQRPTRGARPAGCSLQNRASPRTGLRPPGS